MRESQKIVVIGSGGHALSVLDVAASAGFSPYAVIDPRRTEKEVFGLPVISHFDEIRLRDVSFCLGIGSNFERELLYREVTRGLQGAKFPALLHSSSSVSPTANIAGGAVLMAHSSVGPGSSVGLGAVLNTGSSIDHEAELGNFASLAPGARTGGGVQIGERTLIGMGAMVIQGISIGFDTVIGALSMVKRDVSELTVAYGNPCQAVRSRRQDERYY